MTRTYTTVGAAYTNTPELQRTLDEHIARLTWEPLVPGKRLPMMPGLGIRGAIETLRIPKVSAIAYNGVIADRYALYGIEATYANGRARIYILDRGADLLVLASDFEPAAALEPA